MARLLRRKSDFCFLPRSLSSQYSCSQSLQTLAYEELRTSEDRPCNATAFVLHGLLGCGGYWRSFSRTLLSKLSDLSPSAGWRMVLVDLRNHGRSAEIEGFDPPHNMANAANDLADLVQHKGWGWPDVVLGHSLGAKVGLQYAESCGKGDFGESSRLPKQLWVFDSVPGEVSPENSDGGVEILLRTLQNLPSSLPSREWLVNHMIELGFSRLISEWIGSNLKKSGEHETWVFNLEGAVQMFNSHRETSYWPVLEHPPKGMDISFVRAENSNQWDPDTVQRLESLARREGKSSMGKVSVHVLPNAGHWVHVDNPKGLLDIVAPKMASLSASQQTQIKKEKKILQNNGVWL